MRQLVILLSLVFCLNSFAQSFEEFAYLNRNNDEYLIDVITNSEDNFVVLASRPGEGFQLVYIFETSVSGEILWEMDLSYTSSHFPKKIVESTNGYFVCGHKGGVNTQEDQVFVAFLDASGEELWLAYFEELSIATLEDASIIGNNLLVLTGGIFGSAYFATINEDGEEQMVDHLEEYADFDPQSISKQSSDSDEILLLGRYNNQVELSNGNSGYQQGGLLLSIQEDLSVNYVGEFYDERPGSLGSNLSHWECTHFEDGALLLSAISWDPTPNEAGFFYIDENGEFLSSSFIDLDDDPFLYPRSSVASTEDEVLLSLSFTSASPTRDWDIGVVEYDRITHEAVYSDLSYEGSEWNGQFSTVGDQVYLAATMQRPEFNGLDIGIFEFNDSPEPVFYGVASHRAREWASDIEIFEDDYILIGRSDGSGGFVDKLHLWKTNKEGELIETFDIGSELGGTLYSLAKKSETEVIAFSATPENEMVYNVINIESGELLAEVVYDVYNPLLTSFDYHAGMDQGYFPYIKATGGMGLKCINGSGEELWEYEENESDYINNYQTTALANGDCIVVSRINENVDGISVQVPKIQSVNSDGQLDWTYSIPADAGTSFKRIWKMIETAEGDLVGVGSAKVGAQDFIFSTLLLKLDGEGNLIYEKEFEASHNGFGNYSLVEDVNGDLFIQGHLSDETTDERILRMLKIDPEGELLESWTFGDEVGERALFYNLKGEGGQMAMGGQFNNGNDVDLGLVIVNDVNIESSINALHTQLYRVSPNPANSGSSLLIQGLEPGNYDVGIFDNSAKQVYQFVAEDIVSDLNLDLPGLRGGLYSIKLVSEGKTFSAKVVLF